jgi:hypothetical protein
LFPNEEPARRSSSKKKKAVDSLSFEDQLTKAKEQIATEKAGKRKLFHSIVKLADELQKARSSVNPFLERKDYAERTWHAGGMWRAPDLLPSVTGQHKGHRMLHKTSRLRESISLSDLFFNLVIVTGFTRVGVAMSEQGGITFGSFCYFTIFFTVWSKQASYSTRFDTTDLSAQITTLITCFAVLFASLSVQAPINTEDADRIMIMAAAVALLNACLFWRVLLTSSSSSDTSESDLAKLVSHHAIFNIVATTLEAAVWLYGCLFQSCDWEYRWVVFVVALLLASFRIPRAFLANDFHGMWCGMCVCYVGVCMFGTPFVKLTQSLSLSLFSHTAACSKRGVLFILLLGFLLQSVVVVASEFFAYETPSLEQYSFIGAVCLLFFCIKLLYVDDESDTLAQDHALLVNRWAAFFFHFGQFFLLLSVTVLGSGLNLLTHAYLAATAALPGPEKSLVCGGFSAALLSTFFIKSMHVKRIPTDSRNRALFVAAYVLQTIVLLGVAVLAAVLSVGSGGSVFQYLLQSDSDLVFVLAGAAVFVVLMSWLDEGVELTLYETVEDSRAYRVHPFGFWFCCGGVGLEQAEQVSPEEEYAIVRSELDRKRRSTSASSLTSVLSPLLAHSIEKELRGYDSVSSFGKSASSGAFQDV